MSKLLARKAELLAEVDKIDITLEKLKGNRTLLCGCGKKHKIKELTLMRDHWYVEPYSCSAGDYYNEGEKSFLCLDDPSVRNRIFDNNWKYKVSYSNRDKLCNDIIEQFMREYRSNFKELIEVYDDKYEAFGVTHFYNCEYLGTKEGMKKFDLSVKDIE